MPDDIYIQKSFHEKLNHYYQVRDKIFNSSIPKVRVKAKSKKQIFKTIESSIIADKADDRAYLQISIGNEKIHGLVDSGANISCLGSGSEEFLKRNNLKMLPLEAQLRTACGTNKVIIGFVKIPIIFRGLSKEFTIYVAPSLLQPLYLGTDFIRFHQLAPSLFPPRIEEIFVPDEHSHVLTDNERSELNSIISQFPSCEILGLGKTHVETHVINVGNSPPIKSRHYPVSPVIQSLINDEVDRMLALGVIEPSESPWSCPVTLVRKPSKNRLCLDFRKVNAVTEKLAYPIPNLEGLLSRLSETRYISSVDLKDAFWQIPLDEESRKYTAFTVPGRPLYQFRVMPFGLCNAPQRMTMLMDKVFPSELRENVFIYLDDLLIVSKDYSTHVSLLKKVALYLSKAGLTINVSKSKFCFNELKYLGYIVSDGCLKVDPDKVRAIREFPSPKTKRQARAFLGLAGWYRRFIENFSSIASPITETLKLKSFQFSDEACSAFQLLKEALTSTPLLVHPDFSKPFYVQCDASDVGIGGVLFQYDTNGDEKPIYFYSAKLNSAQKNYSVTERECLAVIKSIEKFRPYVEGYDFTVITDHSSLKWLMTTKDLNGRLARWSLKLQPYTFTVQHRKGTQNIVADSLSRNFEDTIAIDALELDDICKFHLDLNDKAFQSEDYLDLIEFVKDNVERLNDLMISDGFVYKRTKHTVGHEFLDTLVWKLWIPVDLRHNLIVHAHDPPHASHGGIGKTLFRLRERFFWPAMALDVKEYIHKCDICQTVKSPNRPLKPPLGQTPVAVRPFQRLFMDFLGPYPRSRAGNTKVLVILDQLTKFVFLQPLKNSKSENVVKYLKDWIFPVFGVPQTILTDNGREFISCHYRDFLKKFGVDPLVTAVHSPQGNSSERVNRSVLEAIRCYIQSDHRDWDLHLQEIACALRSSYHRTIGVPPYLAVFGQDMISCGEDYDLIGKLCSLNQAVELLPKNDRLQLLRDHIKRRIDLGHEENAKKYNLRARSMTFNVDQEVYCRAFPLSSFSNQFNAKFAPKFIKGRILSIAGTNRYEVGNLQGKRLGVFHAKDIKPG